MALQPGQGHLAYVQIAKESVVGTPPAAAQYKMEVMQSDPEQVVMVLEDPSLYGSPSRRGIYNGPQWAIARLTQRFNYDGFGAILRAALSDSQVTGPDANGLYTHVFKEKSTLDTYTIDFSIGDVPSGKVLQMSACRNTGIKFAIKASESGGDGFMTVETEWIGIMADPGAVGTTPMTVGVVPSVFPVLFHHFDNAGSTTGTGDTPPTYNFLGFELEISQPHKPRVRMGTLTTDTPLRSEFMDQKWRYTFEWSATAGIDRMMGGVPGSIFAKFIDTTPVVASFRSILFKAGNQIIQKHKNPVAGYGVIEQEVEYYCARSSVDASVLVITLMNLESGAY